MGKSRAAVHFYLIAGIALIALELATTTFYLLVIGLASVIAGVLALFLTGWLLPTVCAGFLSIAGCFVVSAYRRQTRNNGKMLVSHLGQSVEVIQITPLLVLYSGSYWSATTKVPVKIGDKLHIIKFSNTELEIE